MQWSGLSEHLIAKLFEVDHNGLRIGAEIQAPLADGATLEGTFNWTSPFENSGAESKAPMLAAMLQSGAIQPVINAMTTGGIGGDTGTGALQGANSFLDEFRGKTGITRLNSTQIFSGMPPIKISCTLIFRAFRDARKEVEEPYEQLWKWALLKKLADDGALSNVMSGYQSSGVAGAIKALMPSEAPSMIGMTYKNRTIAPLVIESISEPMDMPVTSQGEYARMAAQVSLSTLSAMDQGDWVKLNSKSS